MTHDDPAALFAAFRASLGTGDLCRTLHDAVIGHDATFTTPFGEKRLIYADFVASGRAVMPLERFILERVLPFYANSHTEASYCGGFMTRMRREARALIAGLCGADTGTHAVIFTGSGATAGINRAVHLFGLDASVRRGDNPAVLIGPYEHHSNILPWRESGAEVIEVAEADCGGPCPIALAEALDQVKGRKLVVAAFSAASNVTGIISDVAAITRQLKAAGAKVLWDYAGGGPYMPIAMTPANDAAIDAVVISPHKFLGGPGASGVMIIRRDAVSTDTPTLPGGGTVRFVSPWDHVYSDRIEAREEGGTPNGVGDIRAALCFILKDAIGQQVLDARHEALTARAMAALGRHPRIVLLGTTGCRRLPIISLRIKGRQGYLHQQLLTRMLSDRYGIQARGGCACAGPYVHRLLGLDESASRGLQAAILSGEEIDKPGFVRFNLSALLSDDEAGYILDCMLDLADTAEGFADRYRCDRATAIFSPEVALA